MYTIILMKPGSSWLLWILYSLCLMKNEGENFSVHLNVEQQDYGTFKCS